MIRKPHLATLMLSCILSLSVMPAWAVRYDSIHYKNRYNSAGSSYKVLPTNSDHFCYLSTVTIEETDTGGEEATCRLRRSGAVWLLEAILGKSSDADVECTAICYSH